VRRRFNLMWNLLLALAIILTVLSPAAGVQAHALSQSPEQKAKDILDLMTPEERVGQLFLITFKGRDVSPTSPIYDLIVNKHVGGVVLQSANDNFTGPDNTVVDAYQLTNQLQQNVWDGGQQGVKDPVSGNIIIPQYVPLFIGISQEGDQYPYDEIINGLTRLPNLMAIGATWQPDLAQRVGNVQGQELSDLGVNLLLGPSLDVLDVLHTEGSEDLGTRTFGGDPYWVGVMGDAYITGIHQGSSNRLAVIAKHFPGRGGSDRPPEEEVATVRKSLEQLKQIELAPFFSVTGNAPTSDATTDGLLVSHIRYQGFQGNIRDTTRPVSFDPAALEQILSLTPFTSWRQNGGVMVSDDLGSNAVRNFYDPTGQSFDARQVARDAFLAGNDLLYANNFIATGDPDSYTTISRTLDYFAQKYREDPAFAQRVNVSVQRLLQLKLRLYPTFDLSTVVPPANSLDLVGKSDQVSIDVAQQSATLLSPSASELRDILPRPPSLTDRIVILTDLRTARQCNACPDQSALPVDALQKSILKFYGPRAGGQVNQTKISSYSFSDLLLWLNSGISDKTTAIDGDINLADWIVISFLNVQADQPDTLALRRFLSEKSSLLRNKKVIAFAFNAPYYLDATDISKLTAYYGLYSKTPAFVDMAARILFQEITPSGSLPVSVPGLGYDLIQATSPDPAQVIPLYLDLPDKATPTPSVTPKNSPTPGSTATSEPTAVPKFKVGDTLPLRTGIIYDNNHNQVPDGTVVRFMVTISGVEGGTVQQIDTTTSQGIAHAAFRIQTAGLLEFRVASDPAETSALIRLDISAGAAAAITAIAPPTISPTVTVTPSATPTSTVTPTAVPLPPPPPAPGMGDWLLAVLVSWVGAAIVFTFGRRWFSLRWGVRWGLSSLTGGLVAYTYLVAKMPGSDAYYEKAGVYGVMLVSLAGILIGWGLGWLWKQRAGKHAHPPTGGKRPTAST
jgi:beta-N-acetylhexosaminidase